MTKDMFYLGELDGSHFFLEDFSFDCDWYWGGGYVQEYSRKVRAHSERSWQSHTHFSNYNHDWLLSLKNDKMDEASRWRLLDLMKQFYALRECAEIYQYGGHMCSENVGVEHNFKPSEMSNTLNADIEKKIIPQVHAIFANLN